MTQKTYLVTELQIEKAKNALLTLITQKLDLTAEDITTALTPLTKTEAHTSQNSQK
jgi:hypothetical protein